MTKVELTAEQRVEIEKLLKECNHKGNYGYLERILKKGIIDNVKRPRALKSLRDSVKEILWPCICLKDETELKIRLNFNCPQCCYTGPKSPRVKTRTQMGPGSRGVPTIQRAHAWLSSGRAVRIK